MPPAYPAALAWEDHPAALALVHYARGLGAARSGELDRADEERRRIGDVVARLRADGNAYWAYMTEALGTAVEAWTLYERGETDRGLALMREAADLEDSMDKHPITPGEVLPVRELYGELLLRAGRPTQARAAFEASLERTPNRRHALAGLDRAGAATRR
jgi:tetratricopeptide (TPR) repeat protein